ncbi:hypothetical protein FKW77_009073 [Venturia effusa]|uniref:F-box domain-containing protein n=1 Tax=Venturia effusa TaxID=50376 RepID=A0A517LEI2_9PEZI|nr:hypothetical protein FKW77_009073 [Venturia effusa]
MSTPRSLFITLPLEMLELIFNHITDPLDFCNASSTCKTLQSASSRLMKEHRALAERYQICTLDLPLGSNSNTTVWALLHDISNDRRIRNHIRELEIEGGRQSHYEPSYYEDYEDLVLSIDEIRPSRECLDQIRRMDGFQSLPFYTHYLQHGRDDSFNALLLRQLPNLKALTYVATGDGATFLNFIEDAGNMTAPPPYLTKLETVTFSHWHSECGMDIDWLIAFMRLPSIRIINGHMIKGKAIKSKFSLNKSNVTTLDFTCSCIEVDFMDKILEQTQNLKHFSYEHNGALVRDSDWDPHGMVASLLEHTGHSLEALEISGREDDDMIEEYCPIRNFKKLKYVSLDHLILVPSHSEIMNDANPDGPFSQSLYENESHELFPPDLDLTNALPPTIEHLEVNKFLHEDGLPSVGYLLTAKEQGRFPELKKISLHSLLNGRAKIELWNSLKEIAARVDVILEDSAERKFAKSGKLAEWRYL